MRHADDPQPIIAEGEWHGEILPAARGDGGFGYDPLFYVPEFGKTAAELDAAEKNRRSHRGQALQPDWSNACKRVADAIADGRPHHPDRPPLRGSSAAASGNRPGIPHAAAALALRAYSVVRAEMPVLRLQLA